MTNGVISIVIDGKVAMKLVTGHDGMNAPDVAERIRTLGHVPTVEEAREIALSEGFGCRECLIVGTSEDPFGNDHMREDATRDVPGQATRYWTTFDDPRANPRWQHEAEYTEIVKLFAPMPSVPDEILDYHQALENFSTMICGANPSK